jgi:outer membrane lipoprotein SlyB
MLKLARDALFAIALVMLGMIGCVQMPTASDGAADLSEAAWSQGKRADITVDEQTLTPAERRLRQQSEAFQRTVWEGALTGATAGSVLGGWLVGGIRGAIAAGTAGGAGGSLAGAYVARKQSAFASAEDQLEAMVADLRSSNRAAQYLIASARDVIAQDRRTIAGLEQRLRAGQATQAELESARKRVEANAVAVRNAAQGAGEQYEMFSGAERIYRTRNQSADTNDLQRELHAFRKQIVVLDGLVEVIDTA